MDLSREAFRISICYRSDTGETALKSVQSRESRRVRVNPRRYRCALSFRICHVPSRSDENETTAAGNCVRLRAKRIRAMRDRKPVIKRDTARSARWWILYAYQSLNYTWWDLCMSLFPSASIRHPRDKYSRFRLGYNMRNGLHAYLRSRMAPSEIIVQLR